MKDYYKIMNVSYDASPVEIRSAYHQLAKKYHPDKNPGNTGAAITFVEIQEAYFILSDEERRQQFHLRSKYPFAKRPKAVPETPDTILKKANQLNKLLQEIDVFRMNSAVYTQSIHLLLSEQNINTLKSAGDQSIKHLVVEEILQVCRMIPYRDALRISTKLLVIAGHNETLQHRIYRFTNQKRIRNFWEKYNPVIIILLTLIICLFILILSN